MRRIWLSPTLLSIFEIAGAVLSAQQTPPAGGIQPTSVAQPAQPIPNLQQNQTQGSRAEGEASPTPLNLTLSEAIARGLKTNLAILVRETGNQSATAARRRALSSLLPEVSGALSENVQQTNLQSLGIRTPFIPRIVGPFGFTDVRAYVQQTVFDWTAYKNLQTAKATQRASELSQLDARDLVVQAVASAYFQIIATAARVQSLEAQVDTAEALFKQASDQRQAGTSPGIDVLRSQVELKTDQQQLVAQRNQFEKDKLTLARIIGLPPGQQFNIADRGEYEILKQYPLDEALHRAYANRADYQSALSQVRAAEQARMAAVAERYPTLYLSGSYGDIGTNLASSHGTLSLTGSLKFNIFDGGRIRADVEQADATLRQRKDDLADLKGRIDYEIRNALLDLKSTSEQVEVARANMQLANETLRQSRDRFRAGVTNNVEVVQAQQQVAGAEQNYISSLFAHNLSKVSLARALGEAESGLRILLGASAPQGEKKQ